MKWYDVDAASVEVKKVIESLSAPVLGQSRLRTTPTDFIFRDGEYLLVFYDNDPKPLRWTLIPVPDAEF